MLDKVLNEQQAGMYKRINSISATRSEARRERNDSIAQVNGQVRQVDASLQRVRTDIAGTESQLNSGRNELRDAETALVGARQGSQMHRLAKIVFGQEDDAAAERMLGWFAAIAAAVLAMAGTGLAAVYFRTKMKIPAELAAARQRNEQLGRAFLGFVERLRDRALRGWKIMPGMKQPGGRPAWDVLQEEHEVVGGRADPH